jgi:hypothetical protein
VRIGVKPGQYGWSWAQLEAAWDALTFILHTERGPDGVERLAASLRRAGWL